MTVSIVSIAGNPSRGAAVALLESADLPTVDLTDEHMKQFFYCGPPAEPTALVGVELCGSDALLRSLVVRPGHRSQGLAAALVRHVEHFARENGAAAMYLLTTTAGDFFRRCGYVEADRRTAPAGIRATREFAGICPASSAFLFKRL